jgi:hypothetical protein
MPTIADYSVILDGVTLPQGNGDIDLDFGPFSTPAVNFGASPVLMFRVDPSGGNVTMQVRLNGSEVLTWPFFNEPQPRSFHEVIPANVLRPTNNILTVTRSQGQGNFTISDIVVFYQVDV